MLFCVRSPHNTYIVLTTVRTPTTIYQTIEELEVLVNYFSKVQLLQN